jgi:hypothetical protein
MGGWSGYVNGKKKHYFHEDSKTSICGFAFLHTAKVKSIFYKEDISSFHTKTVCSMCLREYKRIIGQYDPVLDCRNRQ